MDDTLCTRFATRIVSRRTAPGTSDIVQASIEPGDINPFGYKADPVAVKGFEQTIPSLTSEVFKSLIEKVNKCGSQYIAKANQILGKNRDGNHVLRRL